MENKQQSLFKRIGGKDAVNAAVEIFYRKVLEDESVKPYFEKTEMNIQIERQKMFLTYVFGGLPYYKGKNIRDAHKHMKLKNGHYEAVVKHLFSTLRELKLKDNLIAEVAAIVYTTKDDVLNRESVQPI